MVFFQVCQGRMRPFWKWEKRVIVIFLTFDWALLQNIVIGKISNRNTFFKNCLALNCFAGQSVYHRTFYFWCQVLTKETNNIFFFVIYFVTAFRRIWWFSFLTSYCQNHLWRTKSISLLTRREQGNKIATSLVHFSAVFFKNKSSPLVSAIFGSTALWWKWLLSRSLIMMRKIYHSISTRPLSPLRREIFLGAGANDVKWIKSHFHISNLDMCPEKTFSMFDQQLIQALVLGKGSKKNRFFFRK